MKKRLFTPGPVSAPEEVLLEMAKPIIHHRTPEFLKIAEDVIKNLKYFFQTENDVFILSCSGTGAMEASVVNIMSPGEKMLVISGGKFGERFIEIGKAYNCNVITIEPEWGAPLNISTLEKILNQNPDTKAVFATLCETSTATSYDIEAIGKIISKYPKTVFIVDGISGLGAVPCLADKGNIDMLICGSQKALMLPPGLAFISVSKKTWELINSSSCPSYYFDLKKYKKAMEKYDFPFTMAVSLVIGLRKSLQIIREQGLENLWEKHAKRANAVRKAAETIGLEVFSRSPSDAVTCIMLPANIDGEKFVSKIRDEFGISIAGGQGKLKGKCVRISHFGYQDEFDTISSISAIEVMLNKFGYKVEPGKGVKTCLENLF